MPTAVANLALHRVHTLPRDEEGLMKSDRMCIVRQAGSMIGRLAKWEVV
jgi:hypothetical protein